MDRHRLRSKYEYFLKSRQVKKQRPVQAHVDKLKQSQARTEGQVNVLTQIQREVNDQVQTEKQE